MPYKALAYYFVHLGSFFWNSSNILSVNCAMVLALLILSMTKYICFRYYRANTNPIPIIIQSIGGISFT